MKPRHPREQVSEEPPNIPQERAFAFYAPQLLEERQRQYLRVRKLLEGFVAFAARVEAGVSVVHEAEEHDDRLFNGAQGGGMLASGHPRFLSSGSRMASVVPSIHATLI
jgi:hypothetical protein